MKRLLITLCVFCFCVGIIAQTTDDEKYELANTYYKAKKYDKAVPILKELAEKNNAKAINFLGVCYEHGNGLPKDIQTAIKYYEKSATLGWRVAQRNLGICNEFGRGMDKNLNVAEEWYKKSIASGDTLAMVRLGWLYLHMLDEYRESSWDYYFKQSEKWFRQAAKHGHPEGYSGLAWLYYSEGEGQIIENIEKSTPFFKKAAEMGNGDAQLFMGYADMRENKYESALNWFKQAGKNDADTLEGITPSIGETLCTFFINNPEYQYYWDNDCCAIDNYIYPEADYYLVGATSKGKLGFLKISNKGKLLAHTPFIYETGWPHYDTEAKLFHVYLKDPGGEDGREITIDITGKEIQQ
ncbi:MAG: tetratricopeptide repeat protein [Lachnospiraceae bacterium]|nr:tetratricopeptide repeat protein [Lachnospiraceae bacterium]